MMMASRLGDTTTTSSGFPSAFISGATSWTNPSAALTAAEGVFSSPSTAFSSANLATTLGLLAVPAVLIFFLMGKHR